MGAVSQQLSAPVRRPVRLGLRTLREAAVLRAEHAAHQGREHPAEHGRQRTGHRQHERAARSRVVGLYLVRARHRHALPARLPGEGVPGGELGHGPEGALLAGLFDHRAGPQPERPLLEALDRLHRGHVLGPGGHVRREFPDDLGRSIDHPRVRPFHADECTIWYMAAEAGGREQLLERVVAFAAAEGIAGRSLRDIAAGVGTSHRMLLYHFGSREGLMAAIVATIEAQQRAVMTALTEQVGTPREVMLGLWDQLTRPELLPFVRLFFEVFGLLAQDTPATRP